jgi:hypothetical protein
MGISIDIYRARVGLYQFCGHSSNLVTCYNHVKLILTMIKYGLPIWFLALLLLSGDVKPNPGPSSHLPCLLLNTRSVKSVNRNRNKLIQLQSIAELKNAGVICLTETWLSPDILDHEILPPASFHVYRKDRNNNGGGVLVATRNDISSSNRNDLVPSNTGLMDILVVALEIRGHPKSAIICVYIPPGLHSATTVQHLRDTLKAIWLNGFRVIHLMGDFNLPNLDPESDTPTSPDNCCFDYYETFRDYNLSHVINFPTHRGGNRLDLILSTTPDKLSNISCEEDLFSSDHHLINFSLDFPSSLIKSIRTVYNYKKADWQGLKAAIIASDLNSLLDSSPDLSEVCSRWTNTLLALMKRFIPTIKLKNVSSSPWIDGEVISLCRRKERSRQKALRNNSPDTWTSYRHLRNKLKTLIQNKYNSYIASTFSNLSSNPKRFWGLVRAKCKNKSLPDKITNGDLSASNAIDKANLLNNFFYSNFTPPYNDDLPNVNSFINPDLCDLTFSIAETRLLLTSIDSTKATGPDELPGILLKTCAAELAPSLTKLFNLSLSSGLVPDLWKQANVIPVLKKGDKSKCQNYRPISLLSITSKLLERAVLNKIYNSVLNLITPSQHGFLQGRSTSSQLLSVFHRINNFLDSATQTDVLYLDFSKAFDSVSHKLLCHKLTSFGFSGNLLLWITSYLNNRCQRVSLEGESSGWLPVTSGVPQGSILGPFLFLLFSNDIGDTLSQGTHIALYADDAKIFRPIHSAADCLTLQSDLDELQTWSDTWKLSFNALKCQVLSITRSEIISFNYELNNLNLNLTQDFNDLGVLISNNFSWKSHISSIISRANRTLGLIKRTLGFTAPMKAKLLLYKSLVRSTLMYASVIWSPDREHLKLLEGIQRHATKYILNDYVSDYKTRLINTGLLPLSYLREIYDLIFFYKCTNGFYNLDLTSLIPFRNSDSAVTTRNDHDPLRLEIPISRTVTARRFFSFRIVDTWNSLPLSIRSVVCTNKNVLPLKQLLFLHYRNKLSTFDPDNCCTWATRCTCAACRPT